MARTTRGRAAAAAAVVAGATLTSCSAEPEEPTLPETLPTDAEFAYSTSLEPGEDDGLLAGTVELLDGCLVIVPDGGGDPVVPVLPIAVTTFDGTELVVDDTITDIGRSLMLPGGPRTDVEDDWVVPEACPEPDGERKLYFSVNLG